jgi:glycosyltransferase involved in cell wall biosynthesis
MRVFAIGPIYPLRGGIAHSNRILCENLSRENEVVAISFSRMYPALLYPGRAQKELNSDSSFAIDADYALDCLNPLSWLKVAARIRRERPDRVLFQWWHTFFAPMFWVIAAFGGNRKTRFGAICQNVLPHEESRLHEFLTRFFFRRIDYFIALSGSDLRIMRRLMPRKRAAWITESTTESQFGKKPAKREARAALGLEGDTLLFFGFVRPYKGLKYLIEALPIILGERPGLKLMIVGEFWRDREEYLGLIRELGLQSAIMIVDRYVSSDEVPTYFAAADAVVLPYLSSTESGIIQLAYGLNEPVITTAVGGNVDLIEHGKTGMLCEPADPRDLARAVLEFYSRGLERPIREAMLANAELFSWTKRKEDVCLDRAGGDGGASTR